MERTDSKLGKEYIKDVYCHPAYLTNMQSTSCEMPGWMNQKLESRQRGEISTISYMQSQQYAISTISYISTLMVESE